VLLHPLGEDFVLALELLQKGSDLAILGVFGGLAAFAGLLEGRATVLKELLLPAVEERDGDAEFVAQVGKRDFFQEVEAEQGDLLLGTKVAALWGQGSSSARVWPLTPAKANSNSDWGNTD